MNFSTCSCNMTNTGEQEIIHNIFNLSVAGFGRRGESWDGPCTRPMLGGPSAPQTLLIFKDHYQATSGWSSLQLSHQLPFVIQLQSKSFPSGNCRQKASLFPVAKQLRGKKNQPVLKLHSIILSGVSKWLFVAFHRRCLQFTMQKPS